MHRNKKERQVRNGSFATRSGRQQIRPIPQMLRRDAKLARHQAARPWASNTPSNSTVDR